MMNYLSLILLNIIYFMCNVYPKHIFEINSPFPIFSFIFNILFYIMYALFLVVAVNKNKNLFSKNLFDPLEKFVQKVQLKRIMLICAIQIILDLIVLLLNAVANKNILYISDFATVLVWIAIYSASATKENNIFRHRRSGIIVAILIALMALTTWFNYIILQEYSLVLDMYKINAEQVEDVFKNLDFLFGVKNFFLDTFSGLVLLAAHRIFNRHVVVKENQSFPKRAIRSFVLICLAFCFVGIKILLFPFSCIAKTETSVSETQIDLTNNEFCAVTKTTLVKRIDSSFLEKVVFQKTNNKLYYHGVLVLEYNSADDIHAISYYKDGNQLIMDDCFEKFIAGDVEYYLYKNQVICFVHENVPTAVYSGNTMDTYNEDLVTIYRSVIENHNWSFFKQGAEYLFKYDSDFIKPYLERYSSSKFEEDELKVLNEMCIKESYIQRTAKQLLHI